MACGGVLLLLLLLLAGTLVVLAAPAVETIGATKYEFVYGTLVCGDACSPSMRRGLALYGEWQRAVFTFLARYIDENAMVFDLLGGPGLGLVSFGHLLPTARIVSIEPRRDLYPFLSHNTMENAMFNRTLVGCFGVTRPAAPMAAINSGVGTDRNAFDLYRMVNVCPAVVKIGDTPGASEHDTVSSSTNSSSSSRSNVTAAIIDSLIQALPLVAPCRPVFYVDNSHVDASYTIVRVLTALPGYNLYWHVSTALGVATAHRRGDNAVVVGLVAVPRARDATDDPRGCADGGVGAADGEYAAARCDALRVPYEEGKFYLADYGLDLWLAPAPSPAQATATAAAAAATGTAAGTAAGTADAVGEAWVTGSLARPADTATCPAATARVPAAQHVARGAPPPAPPCAGAPPDAHTTITVHLDAVLGPYPTLQTVAAAPAVPPLRFAACLLPAAATSIDAIAAAHCTIWAHALPPVFKRMPDSDDDMGHFPALARACAAFAAKQWQLYSTTYLHTAALPLADSTATTAQDDDVLPAFTPEAEPFKLDYQPDMCGEPVWCNHTVELHRRLHAWQSPDSGMTVGQRPPSDYGGKYGSTQVYPRTCANVRYLVFQPPSNAHGIGAMMGLIATAFRYALCLGRVFILEPTLEKRTLKKWRHPGCQASTFECYFRALSDCPLSEEDLAAGHELQGFDEPYHAPVRDVKVLIVNNFPLAGGICKMCGDGWTGDRSLFEGLGLVSSHANSWYFESVDEYRKATAHLDPSTLPLYHATTFLSATRLFFTSMFLRYLVRPRPWLQETLQRLVRMTLVRGHAVKVGGTSPSSGNGTDTAAVETVRVDRIPRPFVSMHVRYGAKIVEVQKYQPLERYMLMVKRKYPQARDIFVSTETEAVIHTLIRDNPGYRFYYLSYGRVEYLDLAVETPQTHAPDGTLVVDFTHEFFYSLANLFVAVDGASGYVGSLSSSWCTTTNVLQRTRGDAGFDFLSVDRGSSYSVCF